MSGSRQQLDRHHVYPGSRRRTSEEWGCWVWLRHDIHMDIETIGHVGRLKEYMELFTKSVKGVK